MIDEDRTMQLYGYTSDMLSPQSYKPIVKVCEECGKYGITSKSHYHDLCKSCASKKRYKPPIPKFVLESDRFISDTGIDRILTIEKFGYDPIDLKDRSGREIVAICQKCGKSQITSKHAYCDLCRSCASKGKHKLPTPKFVSEQDRFISGTGIDRILTIEKFGYDPIDFKKKSGREIVVICQKCGKSQITSKSNYRDLCKSCSNKQEKRRIKMSCDRQGISINEFDGFLTDQKYCKLWTESFRESIRERFHNKCFLCDKLQRNRKLSVHHVNYDKSCLCQKLVNLCRCVKVVTQKQMVIDNIGKI